MSVFHLALALKFVLSLNRPLCILPGCIPVRPHYRPCKTGDTMMISARPCPSFKPRHLVGLGLALLLSINSLPLRAEIDDMENEVSISEFIVLDNKKRAGGSGYEDFDDDLDIKAEADAPQNRNNPEQSSAILPVIGIDPSVGLILGAQYSGVDFGDSHMNIDIGASQSSGGETELDATVGTPKLFGKDLIGVVRARFQRIPRERFYGLGNNDVGDEALSKHKNTTTSLLFTLGKRLAPHWVLAGTAGYQRVTISSHGGPHSTTSDFYNLPGIKGGYSNPLSLELIYNSRRHLTRPIQGLRGLAKVTHVGPELGNDRYNYFKFLGDLSYIHPILSPRNLVSIRVNGEYNTGSNRHLPFYEFASIGGLNSLEGFNPNRFLGQSRVFARVGFQRMLANFNFRNIWHVRLDGTVFGGGGRVFLDRSRLPDQLDTAQAAPDLKDRVQYSAGVGLNIALDQAITARIDAAFSRESQGLIYLAFGNAF